MIANKIKNLGHFFLIRNRIKAYKDIDGWLRTVKPLGLYHCATSPPENAVVVEIGTWKGKSTYCISKGLSSGKIYAIDPFDGSGEKESVMVYNEKKEICP